MRNSKVLDIIEELKQYCINVDVYDPWVNHEAEKKWYKHGIIDNPLESNKKYDAIIVAVGHKQFKKLTSDNFFTLSNGEQVVMDVKNIVENPTWTL